jgi:hypothetical protein
MNVWAALRQRNLIGSDAAIVWTCTQHVYFASMLISTTDANGSIGIASLLAAFFHHPWLAAGTLYGFVVLAVLAEWAPNIPRFVRFLLLFPQFVLLMTMSVGAIYFVLAQHYADCAALSDCVFRSWKFISCDQVDRIGMPVWYGTAIVARIAD